jgi:HPr kinase/phosphorylase
MGITVRALLEDPLLGLAVVAGGAGLERPITTVELNRPALELTGYFAEFRDERIQVFGNGELSYLADHERDPHILSALERILSDTVPCAILANGRDAPPPMRARADAASVPLLSCPHGSTKLYKRLWERLEPEFAPETTVHGVLMEIHDLGVLIQGKSSVGKSEVGLELLRRGFHLVADDVVAIKCLNDSILIGRGLNVLPFHMEARGLGIVDVSRLFGAAAILPDTRIALVISLVDWQEHPEYDRLGLSEETVSMLDVQIPLLTIPVKPGRSIGTLVEIAALNQKLKRMGVHTGRLIEQRLADEINANTRAR